jgi:ketosteroid isomerase-like protein
MPAYSTPTSGTAGFTGQPNIREARFEDYPEIAALEEKYGLETKPREEWTDLWRNNSAYREHGKMPIGWVLEDGKKAIVGYLGNIPLHYECEGRAILAAVAHAWVVDVEFRAYAPALVDEYFSQPEVQLFLNATVGPSASEAFAAFGSVPVPVGQWDRSAFWITQYPQFVSGALAMKGKHLPKAVTYPLSFGAFVKDRLTTRQLTRSEDVDIKVSFSFDTRFDQFWDSLRKCYPRRLMGRRSSEALTWHFGHALRNRNAWIVTTGDDSITAYGIFRRFDNPKYGLRRVRLVDFQTLDPSQRILPSMLHWGVQKCRQEGVHMLEVIGLQMEDGTPIEAIAPHSRQLPSWLYFYATRERSLEATLADPTRWYPSQFDGDASL